VAAGAVGDAARAWRPGVTVAPPSTGGRDPVAVVTGANHGIGAATAERLASRGVRVLVAGLPIEEVHDPAIPGAYYVARRRDPAQIADRIRESGGQAEAVALDLATDDAAARLYDHAEALFAAPVRILVHNATGWVGDSFAGPAIDHVGRTTAAVTTGSFDQQFAVDTRAGALLIAEHARRHRGRDDDWGRIVTLSSGGPDGFPSEASYGAAKAALDNFAMTAAAELGSVGITANAVMPPVTDTGWVTEPVRRFVEGSWTHHHVAAPHEVAVVLDWLCSDDAWLVTGNRIVLR
jgi:3-oxoacyl-[acyl-carrier protein] reductase